uniref:PARP catalytic domain-containing protein n=1 Tax=Alexandrium monilatum TaxID=311494 RepID=A0A7S4UWK4_9DINO|mmetsp:Transcript_94152/g.280990  ORF Transcript_94152/g.280990 Transcript_94152/m.280990 type:complete len:400 (+) Transcript_94152:54-1253(+)
MGCGASAGSARVKTGRVSGGPATSATLVSGQCVIALFAEVQKEHEPTATALSADGEEVCWQAGSISLDQWRDFSSESCIILEQALAAWTADPSEEDKKTVEIREGSGTAIPQLPSLLEGLFGSTSLGSSPTELSVDVEEMVQTVVSGEEPLESNCPEAMAAASGETQAKVMLPVRRLAKHLDGGWAVTRPDPSAGHPLRMRRIELRDQDETLNNDFFWRAFLTAMSNSGSPVEETSADQIFDFAHNHDYRNWGGSRTVSRGGWEYRIPVGWKRFAVRVAGRYDNGDNTWLCIDGRKGEWAVVYHGTHQQYISSIVMGGLKAGGRQAYRSEVGEGIYCTPDIEGIAKDYAGTFKLDGKSIKMVVQCRARPGAIKKCSRRDYWVVNDPNDVRPYGVLIQEV